LYASKGAINLDPSATTGSITGNTAPSYTNAYIDSTSTYKINGAAQTVPADW